MNNIDFTKNGGLSFTQYTLAFQQANVMAAFMALAGLIGDKTVISGMAINGSQITNGFASVNGELLEFVGGVTLPNLGIVETYQSRIYNDGQTKVVYTVRQLKCVAGGPYLLADFKRPISLASIAFTGEIRTIAFTTPPIGWLACDGSILNIADYPALFAVIGPNYGGDNVNTFGLPDLRGRVPVGVDGSAEFIALGQYSGLKSSLLTASQIPSVQVPIPASKTSTGQNGSGLIVMGNEGNEPAPGPSLQTTAGTDSVSRLQPSITVNFIIKY